MRRWFTASPSSARPLVSAAISTTLIEPVLCISYMLGPILKSFTLPLANTFYRHIFSLCAFLHLLLYDHSVFLPGNGECLWSSIEHFHDFRLSSRKLSKPLISLAHTYCSCRGFFFHYGRCSLITISAQSLVLLGRIINWILGDLGDRFRDRIGSLGKIAVGAQYGMPVAHLAWGQK